MNQTSLFEVMQGSSIIDRTQPTTEAPSQMVVVSLLPSVNVKAFFNFYDELKANCTRFHFNGYKDVMPLSQEMNRLLRKAYRQSNKNRPEMQVEWQDKYRANAAKNAQSYINSIDKILASDQTKVRHNMEVRGFLNARKQQLEALKTALTTP